MKRSIYQNLLEWKASRWRKPLILNGARQVGKTWVLKEFGKNEYTNVAYINCDNNPVMRDLFVDFDTERLLRAFSAITNERIVPGETLVILDEIQEVPQGLTALKYFAENTPEYHISAAGSLLGLQLHQGTGYPVGKTDQIDLFPMTLAEFAEACGRGILTETLRAHRWEEMSMMRNAFVELLRQYYFTGGMPEAVECYALSRDLQQTRKIQERILQDYRRDFSKHIPENLLSKIHMVWDSIPSQLAKENKKFIYGMLKKGGRAKEFEDAIQWLMDAGLIFKVNRIRKVQKPVKFYEDFGSFKLFFVDLGLLGALTGVAAKDVLIGNSIFSEYKGAFTEQYVAQQLMASGIRPYYYSNDNATMEIDFVIQKDRVYPVEVKAEENLRAKSLRSVVQKNPELTGWRISMSDYRVQDWMVNIPLYAVQEWVNAAE